MPHAAKYQDNAWRKYNIAELGAIVAFFVKRAGHRVGDQTEKIAKDLRDAKNYASMINSHIEEAATTFGVTLL